MSIRARRTRKLDKLPALSSVDVTKVLSDKAILDIQQMEDKLTANMIELTVPDFNPIHDVDRVYSKVRDVRFWEDRDNKIGPECFGGSDYDLDPASVDIGSLNYDGFVEAEEAIKTLHQQHPNTKTKPSIDESWIQTYTGKKLFPLSPSIEDICIEDIAHALSMLCRFTGHTKRFYSVAEHSILVSHICDAKDSLHGLLHDASEYALQDLPSPLKRSGKFETYKEYEKKLQHLIYERFCLLPEEPESVKRADLLLLATESRDLMSPLHHEWKTQYSPLPFSIIGFAPEIAEQKFLDRFFELLNKQ